MSHWSRYTREFSECLTFASKLAIWFAQLELSSAIVAYAALSEGAVARTLLESMGISPDAAVRTLTLRLSIPAASDLKSLTSGRVAFSEEFKRCLEGAMECRHELQHDRLNTGHLLLGIATANEGPGRMELISLGVDSAALRRALEILGNWRDDDG